MKLTSSRFAWAQKSADPHSILLGFAMKKTILARTLVCLFRSGLFSCGLVLAAGLVAFALAAENDSLEVNVLEVKVLETKASEAYAPEAMPLKSKPLKLRHLRRNHWVYPPKKPTRHMSTLANGCLSCSHSSISYLRFRRNL